MCTFVSSLLFCFGVLDFFLCLSFEGSGFSCNIDCEGISASESDWFSSVVVPSLDASPSMSFSAESGFVCWLSFKYWVSGSSVNASGHSDCLCPVPWHFLHRQSFGHSLNLWPFSKHLLHTVFVLLFIWSLWITMALYLPINSVLGNGVSTGSHMTILSPVWQLVNIPSTRSLSRYKLWMVQPLSSRARTICLSSAEQGTFFTLTLRYCGPRNAYVWTRGLIEYTWRTLLRTTRPVDISFSLSVSLSK